MRPAPELRLAGPGDVEQLSGTGTAVFCETYGKTAPPEHVERHVIDNFGVDAIAEAMQQPGVEYHIALVDDACAGLLKLRDGVAPGRTGATSAIEVHQLYVSSSHQGLGIGRLLMERAVAAARERKVEGIWLSVWTEADWATGFYKRCGFIECGTEPFCMGGSEYIDYIMWLDLREAPTSER